MRLPWIGAVLLALVAQFPQSALAQGCTRWDGHGRCLVCEFWYENFTLRPGEAARPFACGDMAGDPRATLVIGGIGTYLGPDRGGDALDHRIGLRIGGRYYAFRRVWGPDTARMPVGPVSVPLGRVHDGGRVEPIVQLTTCRAGYRGVGDCRFELRGKICVTGMC